MKRKDYIEKLKQNDKKLLTSKAVGGNIITEGNTSKERKQNNEEDNIHTERKLSVQRRTQRRAIYI